ncbi:ubiquitinyl hydrolase 1 [Ancylostoma ceylanicum]|uniref:ubiquitinyl hydrolase 1 n=1 Tax=Ancylostoma ceylanicum TaxID=53326 RepID=A0A0D6M486_9BILA|nr:ubiquitinyl hydrolase 1 [Ancylostoma ceylanicum]
MVCGKYFQGRGTNTHAYTHSLDTDHRVFLNLHTLKFYCLPDNYEVDDPSLEDIKYVLRPTYTKELIASLDRQHRMARAYDDSTYFPGVVGLNNIKANDYCNVVLHVKSAKELPFLYLALDLPPAPLYRDEQMQNIIPQVPLTALLQKFNGTTEKEYKTYNENIMKRFELLRLPEYLIITYKRFHKNQWFVEKNPTIVNFPISNVDLYDCLSEDTRGEHKYTTYDLVANVVHDGKPDSGTYRIQLVHVGSRKWFELEDLHVKEILPQMIVLAESYIQVSLNIKTESASLQRKMLANKFFEFYGPFDR